MRREPRTEPPRSERQNAGPCDPALAELLDVGPLDAEFSDPHADDAFLAAIDGPGGWWLVRPEDEEVLLVPTTDATLHALLGALAGGEPSGT